MLRIFKTFLLFLLISAQPIQGMAAVIKMSCGMGQHEPMFVSMLQEHHRTDELEGYQHHHSTGVSADDDRHVGSGETVNNSLSNNKQFPKSSTCSACAACCTGAVAPPSAVILPAASAASEVIFIAPSTSVTHFIPGSLERPPKSIAA
ncbi:hypothetical protein [Paucimonas lemoignei]|uniref:hypothetical protein n=1 Tax=Paucimonas lemoignei TaxID=29443 RepID=UPI00104DDE73|nr:hypothetical protein [Paucimonas lemoignei]